ncbi:MAG: MFS transporter [Pseudomonadota bacterium]
MNYHWRIAGFYFFYFAFVGMFAPYWSLYLKGLHFSAVEISILLSVQPIMRMIAPTIWGWLADRSGRRLLVVQLSALAGAMCYLGVFFTVQFYGMLLTLTLLSFFWSAAMPLVEATTLSYLGKNAAHYGRVRSWGSLGFIAVVLGLGYAFDYMSIDWILWVGLFIMTGILFFSFQLPGTEVVAHHSDAQPISRIMLQKPVAAFFAACFLMAVAHGPYYTFFSIYLVEHGYSKSAVGWLWTVGVLCEIGVFFLMPWLSRHYTLAHILRVSFVCAMVRFCLIAWAVEFLPLLLFAQILHAATFGAFHAAAVALVHKFFQGRHQSQGQALFGSLTYGAGGMVGGLASGPLWQHWGAGMLYSCSAAAALLGLMLLWWKLDIKE